MFRAGVCSERGVYFSKTDIYISVRVCVRTREYKIPKSVKFAPSPTPRVRRLGVKLRLLLGGTAFRQSFWSDR